MDRLVSCDRCLVINTVNQIASGVDTGDWDAVRSAFADEVTTDYTSVHDSRPENYTAEDVIALWREGAEALDAIQHLVSTHAVTLDGNQAECRAAVQTTHRFDDGKSATANPTTTNQWVLAGHYRHALTRINDDWRMNAITFTLSWETGDRGIVDRALAAARRAR